MDLATTKNEMMIIKLFAKKLAQRILIENFVSIQKIMTSNNQAEPLMKKTEMIWNFPATRLISSIFF